MINKDDTCYPTLGDYNSPRNAIMYLNMARYNKSSEGIDILYTICGEKVDMYRNFVGMGEANLRYEEFKAQLEKWRNVVKIIEEITQVLI